MTENERLIAYWGYVQTKDVDAFVKTLANIWFVNTNVVMEILEATGKEINSV